MAETTRPPALQSTADTTPYVPVSWTAAAAATVATVFVLTLIALGYYAFKERKPLIEDWMLVFPVAGFVLCFAAKRMIQNSEGTRTGMLYGVDLVTTAWWVSLLGGLGYVAYLFAIDFSIRNEAKAQVRDWADALKPQPDETGKKEFRPWLAFHRTLPPGARQGVSVTDEDTIRSRFRDELIAFEKTDLIRLAARNSGEGEFQFDLASGGMKEWSIRPGVIDCTVSATVTCPEGKFPVLVSLRGTEGVTGQEGGAGGARTGRQWTVMRPPSGGFIQQDQVTRTPYGWLVQALELDGGAFGAGFVTNLRAGPASHSYVYHGFIAPGGDQPGWGQVAVVPLLQLAFAAPLGMNPPRGVASYEDFRRSDLYRRPGGLQPSKAQIDLFARAWDAEGPKPAGTILKGPDGSVPDKEDEIRILPDAVEIHVPIELPVLEKGKRPAAARGRVIVRCTDPALLAELRQLKASANPETGSAVMPDELRRRTFPWRVARVESDMVTIEPAGPGGPGGGPGGGPRPAGGG
jgi:hypothetical protein